MNKVWVVKNNGQQVEESFPNSQDAINFAKQGSLRAMCCIMEQGKKAIVFEHGEVASAVRSKELIEAVTEIIEHEYEKYAKDGRGKASRKKS